MKKNIPNCITLFRLLLVFVFIFLFVSDVENKSLYCVVTFILSGISDVLDGFLARKLNVISNFGKLMDPLADKLMQITVAVCTATVQPTLIWVPAFLVLKELLMVLGATKLFKKDNIVVQANFYGKLASVICFTVFLVILVFPSINPLLEHLLCLSFVVVSALAFLKYIQEYSVVYKKSK